MQEDVYVFVQIFVFIKNNQDISGMIETNMECNYFSFGILLVFSYFFSFKFYIKKKTVLVDNNTLILNSLIQTFEQLFQNM